jgi:predicted transcriptional regulator
VSNATPPTTGVGQLDDESSTERVLLREDIGRTLASEGYGSVKVLSHEAADRVFTQKRREILRLLEQVEIESQRELARRLDRDPGAVQRDLQALIEADLVTVERDGRAKRPVLIHDTVVVEPLTAPRVDPETPSYTVENEP